MQVVDANGDGWYSVQLPRVSTDGDGYALEASFPGYARAAQYERDIPYARLPASQRRRLIQSARDGDLHPSLLADSPGDPGLRRDVFLSPQTDASPAHF